MAGILAHCDACERTFEDQKLIGGSGNRGVRIKMIGGTTTCPACGRQARILDGEYRMDDDIVTFLTGPQATIDTLIAAGLAIRKAKEQGKSDEEALHEAAAVLPILDTLKGPAQRLLRDLAIGTLLYIAGKFADPYIEPMVKQALQDPARQAQIVREAADHATAQRERAATRAGVVEQSDEAHSPSLKITPTMQFPPQARPRGPQFPHSMEKLQRDLAQRYGYQKRQGSGDRKRNDRKE
jgi:hypothetical protein